jgi:hypothetical protein
MGMLEYEVALSVSVMEALVRELETIDGATNVLLQRIEEKSTDDASETEQLRRSWMQIRRRMAEATAQMERLARESDTVGRLSGELGVVTADTPYVAEAIECASILEKTLSDEANTDRGGLTAGGSRWGSDVPACEESVFHTPCADAMDLVASTLGELLPMVVACALIDCDFNIVESRVIRRESCGSIDELFDLKAMPQQGESGARRRTASGLRYELRRRSPIVVSDSWLPLREVVVPLSLWQGGSTSAMVEPDAQSHSFHVLYIVDRRRSEQPEGRFAQSGMERRRGYGHSTELN